MPMMPPAYSMKSGHSRPSSNDSTVPDTAPTANRMAVPLAQRRVRSRYVASCVRSHKASEMTMSRGMPTPMTAKTIWKASESPIWARAKARLSMPAPQRRRRASSSTGAASASAWSCPRTRPFRSLFSRATASGLRQQGADVLLVVLEVGAGDALQVGGGDGADGGEIVVLERVAADQLEAGQQGAAAMNGVVLEDEAGLDLILGALQLDLADRLALEPLHVPHQLLLERLRGLARQRRGPEPEQVGVEGEVGVVTAGLEGQLALVHEVAVEPRGPAAGQDHREQLERGRVR